MNTLITIFGGRWKEEGGYRHLLVLSFPLILSTGAWSIQQFVDRMFLSWYSTETVAASMPAGILNFTFMSLFIGTAAYVGTFIAQYTGANRPERIGAILWQGIHLAIIGGIFHLLLIPFAPAFFRFVGHDPAVQVNEIIYFQVLCLGAAPAIASAALSGFFSGRGSTWTVMWINALQTAVNLVLDYAMIFGRWGFPEMGMKGAAIATVISGFVSFFTFFALTARRCHDQTYGTIRERRFDPELFRRLLRFGLPSGLQFFMDIAGFTIFILLLGRLGTTALAASNIAFNINTLAFMPMIGLGIGVSILVGQNLGGERTDLAERAAYSGFHLTLFYMVSIAVLYVAAPDLFIAPFAPRGRPGDFETIRHTATILLRFIAFYSIFDGMTIIFSSALKGSGDTLYIMWTISLASLFLLIVPSFLAITVFHLPITAAWAIATFYVIALAFIFYLRFRHGAWKTMRVIEAVPVE